MELEEFKKVLLEIYVRPFKYDPHGQIIFDAGNNMVLDVRGWGHISSTMRDDKKAQAFQDSFGEYVTRLLNGGYL